MERYVVAEGMLLNRWDRISGTVRRVDCEALMITLKLPKNRPLVTMRVGASTSFTLDGEPAELSVVEPDQHLTAIGEFCCQSFHAVSIRLLSARLSKSSRPNMPDNPMQPPGICFWLLDSGEVVIRQIGRPGEEIMLESQEELASLRANPERLRDLLELAHRGQLPRKEW